VTLCDTLIAARASAAETGITHRITSERARAVGAAAANLKIFHNQLIRKHLREFQNERKIEGNREIKTKHNKKPTSIIRLKINNGNSVHISTFSFNAQN